MWTPSLPLLEFVFRGAFVYVFLFAILRITGKRQIGQLAAFDLVLLLVLSNAVQNSMNGGDTSPRRPRLRGDIVGSPMPWASRRATAEARARARGPARGAHPQRQLFPKILEEASLTRHEVAAALRQAGCTSISGSTRRSSRTTSSPSRSGLGAL
jgi:hypothetical protein